MNIGIIGAGVIAVNGHIPAYRQLGHTILAVADNAPNRAEKFSKQLDIPSSYEDYHQLLDRDDIDAVSVCVPTFLHEQVGVDALKAGKHVYLEKPPAFDEGGIRHIYETARETGRILLVGSNSLYQPQYKIAKELVNSGRLGNVYVTKVNRVHRRDIPNGWMMKKQGGAYVCYKKKQTRSPGPMGLKFIENLAILLQLEAFFIVFFYNLRSKN
jgi:predicted dehydrogenase